MFCVVAVFAGSFVWTDITMFTPRPRESEAASSPSGRDVDYERLPPSAIPDRLDPSKRVELEAEMVAVQEKILKTQKLLPDTMKWDGKSDSLESFVSAMGEWIEIRLGERALKAFQGEQMDAGVGGPSMPSCIYAQRGLRSCICWCGSSQGAASLRPAACGRA